ncbi:hypothetical protein [uncultured Stenotrophomonas sp.]|uniref:hypothetical protein n=1 Tax=uncultured Stenotrophomonas sp. TaxID=165438 RepID=UPI0025EA3C92|nr:hypothetical protein [uncultured Stenotrophomonas sp.]
MEGSQDSQAADTSAPVDVQQEIARIGSSFLPEAIKTAGHLSLVAGVAVGGYAMYHPSISLFVLAATTLLSAPFLYGFADIVLSLRRLCIKP